MTPIELYREGVSLSKDIHEHMPTLHLLASMVHHVTELGTSQGCSTSAFVLAAPAVIRTYDIKSHPRIARVEEVAKAAGIDFEYIIADVREVALEQTDLLFIDTWHCEEQLAVELRKHAPLSRQYIVLHDTETFGIRGENAERGLVWALGAYMREHPEWVLVAHYRNCNGLTVLRRR